MSYILCGYDVPLENGVHPKCLLYNEIRGTFGVKTLRTKGCLREAFGKERSPPFLFSRVVDNAFTGGIQLADNNTGPAFTVDTTPHTLLTETDVDDIFKCIPVSIKDSVKDGASIPTKMTEREYVKTTGFKPALLRAVRVALINKMGLKSKSAGGYIPSRIDTLFVTFEPVDYYAPSSKYPHGPDSVILRHKIIKYVLEDACPYIKVALFDSLEMEKALAMCFPTGSTRKGMDIFWPQEQSPDTCLKVADDLSFDGGDFSVLTPEKAEGKTNTFDVPAAENGGGGFFEWVPIDAESPTDRIILHSFEWQLALIKSVYLPGETGDYFRKGAVVYSTHASDEPFACLDFSNFYANVAVKFGLDSYVSEVLKRMMAFRVRLPAMKGWIVTWLGKSRWADPFFYNRMKALSVAVMVSTIKANAHMVTGSVTDGLLVKPEAVNEFVYPASFPVKRDFIPKEGSAMMSSGPSTYAGVCGRTGEVVHRGCIGRGKQPEWYHAVVSTIVAGCLEEGADTTMTTIKSILTSKACRTNQYLLPDTHRSPLAISDKRRGTEFFINELCTGICQMYAIVDDNVMPVAALSGHDPPSTMNVWSIKQINVDKYVEEMKDKISRVAALFSERPDAVNLCEKATEEVVKHIELTLPRARAMYPGGVDYA